MTIPTSRSSRLCRIRTGSTRILCRFARITAPARIAFAICIGATLCFAIASIRAGCAGINSGAVRVVVEPLALPSCRGDLTVEGYASFGILVAGLLDLVPFIDPAFANWAFIAKSSKVLHVMRAGPGLEDRLVAVVGIPRVASCRASRFIIRCLYVAVEASCTPVLARRCFGALIAKAHIEVLVTMHKGTW